jgi:hypothetical protein
MPPTTHYMPPTTHDLQPTTCLLQPTTCLLQPTTYNPLHAYNPLPTCLSRLLFLLSQSPPYQSLSCLLFLLCPPTPICLSRCHNQPSLFRPRSLCACDMRTKEGGLVVTTRETWIHVSTTHPGISIYLSIYIYRNFYFVLGLFFPCLCNIIMLCR